MCNNNKLSKIPLIIDEIKQEKSLFNECFYVIDMLAVLGKFLVGFYFSNKANFQNCFANKLIRWFVFHTVKKLAARVFWRS